MIKYIIFIMIGIAIYLVAYNKGWEDGYENGREAELDEWQIRNIEAFLRWYKIEVPYGKLYDENVFAKAIVESGFGAEFVNKVTGILMNTPTVIEAEAE